MSYGLSKKLRHTLLAQLFITEACLSLNHNKIFPIDCYSIATIFEQLFTFLLRQLCIYFLLVHCATYRIGNAHKLVRNKYLNFLYTSIAN